LKLLEKVESKAGAANKADAGGTNATSVQNTDVKNTGEAQTKASATSETPATVGAQLSGTPESQKPAVPAGEAGKPLDAGELKGEPAAPSKPDEVATPPAPEDAVPPAGGVVKASLGSLPPKVRLDTRSMLSYAGLGLMMFLGCLAVGIQWRHLDDAPARSWFGRGA